VKIADARAIVEAAQADPAYYSFDSERAAISQGCFDGDGIVMQRV
jgi:hypothetical protein